MPADTKNHQDRYEVRAETDLYQGTHPNGLLFKEGRATTDDDELAGLYQGLGFTVTDLKAKAAAEAAVARVAAADAGGAGGEKK